MRRRDTTPKYVPQKIAYKEIFKCTSKKGHLKES